jgi:hypothetical protein
MQSDVFAPATVATAALSASNVTGNVALNPPTSQGSLQVRLYNSGAVPVFIAFGTDNTITATTTSMPLPAGNTEIFSIGNCSYLAGITASGSATVYATLGRGM